MAKDYAKFVPPKSRKAKKGSLRVGSILVSFIVLFSAIVVGCFVYFDKTQTTGSHAERAAVAVSKVMALVQHKKVSAKPAVATVVANNEPPPVHFDFYNELPNMQMPVDDPRNVASVPPPPAASKPAPAVSAQPVPAVAKAEMPETADVDVANNAVPSATTATVDAEAPPVVVKANAPVTNKQTAKSAFDADDVSDLLAAEHKTEANNHQADVNHPAQSYVLQLGVFQSEAAANTLRDAIISVGFKAAVVKVAHGSHKLYHVQQGPYEDVAAAKQLQQRMEKRGIISSIQKASV